MYTKEQNEEIEKVCRVFDSYIRENPYFDVVWSDKLGYIYLSGIAPDREGVCMAPLILRTGEDLCEEIIYNMAADILKQIGVHRDDPEDCSSDERKKIKEELKTTISAQDAEECPHLWLNSTEICNKETVIF